MLPGRRGQLRVEFLVDTGFEGELSLPSNLAAELDAITIGQRPIQVADGTRSYRPLLQIEAEWTDEPRSIEVLIIENEPLLGIEMLADNLITIEMTDGGEVAVEPL
jgi:clan AA aspartic protease